MFQKFLGLMGILLLIGCSSDDKKPQVINDKPVEYLYNEALDTLLTTRDFKKAALEFEQVQLNYPLSPWATKAEIMAGYAYYEAGEYEKAAVALDAFLLYHPRNVHTEYAIYLLGMCFYVQMHGVNRDQSNTHKCIEIFQRLIKLFPKSKYAKDAQLKIDLANEHLAGHAMEIGRYYQQQRILTGSIGRYQEVVQDFQTTSHTPEALFRLVEVFLTLSMDQEAVKAAAVLGHNFPSSKWYQRAFDLLNQKKVVAEIPPESSDASVSHG